LRKKRRIIKVDKIGPDTALRKTAATINKGGENRQETGEFRGPHPRQKTTTRSDTRRWDPRKKSAHVVRGELEKGVTEGEVRRPIDRSNVRNGWTHHRKKAEGKVIKKEQRKKVEKRLWAKQAGISKKALPIDVSSRWGLIFTKLDKGRGGAAQEAR